MIRKLFDTIECNSRTSYNLEWERMVVEETLTPERVKRIREGGGEVNAEDEKAARAALTSHMQQLTEAMIDNFDLSMHIQYSGRVLASSPLSWSALTVGTAIVFNKPQWVSMRSSFTLGMFAGAMALSALFPCPPPPRK